MEKRGIFHNKRGDTTHYLYMVLIEIFLVIVVMFALMSYIDSVAKDTLFEKSYLSKDIALLINTLYASPGNTLYIYTMLKPDISKYSFSFDKNLVTVAELPETASHRPMPVYYPFAIDLSFSKDVNNIQAPFAIQLLKTGDTIRIGEFSPYNLNQLSCPKIDTKNPDWENNIIIIDPGHGANQDFSAPDEEKDYGFVKDTLKESDITREIAEALSIQNPDFISTRNLKFEQYKSLQERVTIISTLNPITIISIHIGTNPNPEINNIKAYIPLESSKKSESKKLACSILNSISDAIPKVSGTSIIPINISELDKEDPMHVLPDNTVAVLLEIGNVQSSDNILQNPDLPIAIYQGIKNYYENE